MRIRVPKRGVFSRENRSIKIEDLEIPYTLQRSAKRRRTLQIQVDPQTGFKVLAPHTLEVEEIEHFLIRRSDWIRKNLESSARNDTFLDWRNGGSTKLLGRDVQILVEERGPDDVGKHPPPTVVKSLDGEVVTVSSRLV